MQIYSVPYRGYGLLPFQVVLPQTGGSHKAGFRLVYSNTKGDFRLDGVFNVISYDVVPKIQSTLLDLDFKVDFLSHISFRLRRTIVGRVRIEISNP
jgi:hypothetical protein